MPHLHWPVALSVILLGTAASWGEGPRAAVPDAAAQAAASKQVQELFGKEIDRARTPAERAEMAQRLLQLAQEPGTDLPARYVLLAKARELASQGGNADVAFSVAQETADAFEVDLSTLQEEALKGVSATVRTVADAQTALDFGLEMVRAALHQDDYTRAEEVARHLAALTRRVKDRDLSKRVTAINAEVADSRKLYDAYREALSALTRDDASAEAHLAAGKFLCFVKNDWAQGAPHLARGSDSGLKQLAELGEPDAEQLVAAGDLAWNLAQGRQTLEQVALLERAGGWYAEANESLSSGLTKGMIEKRLAEIAAVSRAIAAPEFSASTASPGAEPGSGAAAGLIKVCDVLAGKRAPRGLADDCTAFQGPKGNGRVGANGVFVKAPQGWARSGTAWNCVYGRSGHARGVQFIHPFGQGHLFVTVQADKVHVGSPGAFPDGDKGYMANYPGLTLELAANFQQIFQINGTESHQLTSALHRTGKIEIYLDGKIVARGTVPQAAPARFSSQFQQTGAAASADFVLPPGMGGIIIGPLDAGHNQAEQVHFGLITNPRNPVLPLNRAEN